MKVIISGQNFDTKNLEPTTDDVGKGCAPGRPLALCTDEGFSSNTIGSMQELKFSKKAIKYFNTDFILENNLLNIKGLNKLSYYRFASDKFNWVTKFVDGDGALSHQQSFESEGLIAQGLLLGYECSKSLSDTSDIYGGISGGVAFKSFKDILESPTARISSNLETHPTYSIDTGISFKMLRFGIRLRDMGDYKSNGYRTWLQDPDLPQGVKSVHRIQPYKINTKMRPAFYIGVSF
uniref:Uncharacterized protein n=1 Tax=viral metagenome TaxID=1070528 RepID=A0A6C0EK05_9ZZZZ